MKWLPLISAFALIGGGVSGCGNADDDTPDYQLTGAVGEISTSSEAIGYYQVVIDGSYTHVIVYDDDGITCDEAAQSSLDGLPPDPSTNGDVVVGLYVGLSLVKTDGSHVAATSGAFTLVESSSDNVPAGEFIAWGSVYTFTANAYDNQRSLQLSDGMISVDGDKIMTIDTTLEDGSPFTGLVPLSPCPIDHAE